MTAKVVYVSVMRLSEKVARDWFIDFLIENGIDVEFWDVASVVYGDDKNGSMQAAYLRTPQSYGELERLLRRRENRNASYIMLASYENRTVTLFRAMARSKSRTMYISWGAMPPGKAGRWAGVLGSPLALAGKLARRARVSSYRLLRLVNRFDVAFAAGELLVSAASKARRVVAINLIDYDHYRESKAGSERLVDNPYAVFLDINLPYQSDLRIAGMRAVDAGTYDSALARYFDRVEQTLGLEVVIAAHPKSNYTPAHFGGRRTLQGVTAELVRDAEFVMSHHSTSVSYAVLNKKPIIFVYTDGMYSVYRRTIVDQMMGLATYLNAPILNIDRLAASALPEIFVDDARFDAFKYEFLTTHGSENMWSRDLFLREILAVSEE